MSKKLVFVLCLCIFLSSFILHGRFTQVEVKAPNGVSVHNLDTGLNYTAIQAAVDAPETLDGHTIFVEEGTYYEHVVVNKSISLIGENKFSTVIDGNRTGDVIEIVADDVNITGFAIINAWNDRISYSGITLFQVDNCNITGNIIENNWPGLNLFFSSNNTIMRNNVSSNRAWGIWLRSDCNNNTILGNNITENGSGICIGPLSSNNRIAGNRIRGGHCGIIAHFHCMNNDVFGNSLKNTTDGIELWGSSCNNLSRNKVTQCESGIRLVESSDNVLRNNTMADNKYNFGVCGQFLSDFMNDVDTSNIVDRKPIVYLINRQNLTIEPQKYPNTGYLAVVNSTNVTIRNLTLKNNHEGILLGYTDLSLIYNLSLMSNAEGIRLTCSSNNNIMKNKVTNNTFRGIVLEHSDANSISSNNIVGNDFGIRISLSLNNHISLNNFIGNVTHAHMDQTVSVYYNIWDNGYPSGGNYWSDYVGLDLDHDGIGDSDYPIDVNNTDHYPLMGMFSSFNTSLAKNVNVVSNSTIEDFEYFEPNRTIKMHVSNMTSNQTSGFCRVTIPYTLMNVTNIEVIIDNGTTPLLYHNYTLYDNGTHRWIYFVYEHSTLEIVIIPEFPSLLILPLFMLATLLAVIVYRKKPYYIIKKV